MFGDTDIEALGNAGCVNAAPAPKVLDPSSSFSGDPGVRAVVMYS